MLAAPVPFSFGAIESGTPTRIRAAHYLVVTGVSDNYLGNGPAWQVWDPDSGGVYHHLSTRDWAYVSLGRLAILPRM